MATELFMRNDIQQQISHYGPDADDTERALTPYPSTLPVSGLPVSGSEAFPGVSTGDQHLVFQLRGISYALDALAVREIHLLPELTPLSESAPFIVGVLNLRDHVLPVMDLALRLDFEPQPYNLQDCLVVLEHEETSLAIIVNAVESVEMISMSQIEPVPLKDASQGTPMAFIAGVAKIREKVVMLLHLDNLFRWSLHESKHLSLQPSARNAVETTMPQQFFVEHLDAEEKLIFHARASRLMASSYSQLEDGLTPLALILLHGEYYGIQLQTVREFCELRQLSPVPCCPDHIIGQMNLRGDIVTLVDIRPLMQMPPISIKERGNVVVVQHEGASVGVLIDGVLDVIAYSGQESPAPVSTHSSCEKYFCGSVLHDEKIVYILDLNKILAEGNLVVDDVA